MWCVCTRLRNQKILKFLMARFDYFWNLWKLPSTVCWYCQETRLGHQISSSGFFFGNNAVAYVWNVIRRKKQISRVDMEIPLIFRENQTWPKWPSNSTRNCIQKFFIEYTPRAEHPWIPIIHVHPTPHSKCGINWINRTSMTGLLIENNWFFFACVCVLQNLFEATCKFDKHLWISLSLCPKISMSSFLITFEMMSNRQASDAICAKLN